MRISKTNERLEENIKKFINSIRAEGIRVKAHLNWADEVICANYEFRSKRNKTQCRLSMDLTEDTFHFYNRIWKRLAKRNYQIFSLEDPCFQFKTPSLYSSIIISNPYSFEKAALDHDPYIAFKDPCLDASFRGVQIYGSSNEPLYINSEIPSIKEIALKRLGEKALIEDPWIYAREWNINQKTIFDIAKEILRLPDESFHKNAIGMVE